LYWLSFLAEHCHKVTWWAFVIAFRLLSVRKHLL
jgi:hypothetical protein